MAKDNVIDLAARRKQKDPKEVVKKAKKAKKASRSLVVDMAERRQEMIKDERRRVRRTILTEFIGACAVVPDAGLVKVAIYDISEKGLAFDMPEELGAFEENEEVALRVYLNHQTYFPFTVKINNVREIVDEGIHRLGASFIEGLNQEALYHFVKFIETISASLHKDAGDVMVSNLKK